jgi:hypothetical protein
VFLYKIVTIFTYSKSKIYAGVPKEKPRITQLQQKVFDVIMKINTNFNNEERSVLLSVLQSFNEKKLEKIEKIQTSIPNELDLAWKMLTHKMFGDHITNNQDWRSTFMQEVRNEDKRLKMITSVIKSEMMKTQQKKTQLIEIRMRKGNNTNQPAMKQKLLTVNMKKCIALYKRSKTSTLS